LVGCEIRGRAMRSGRAWCCELAHAVEPGFLRHHRFWLPVREARTAHFMKERRPRRGRRAQEATMDVLCERCCGLDIHKRTVVARLILPGPSGQATKEVRSFGTMSDELLALADWLRPAGCTPPWRAPASIGNRSGPCRRISSPCCWSMPCTSRHTPSSPGTSTDHPALNRSHD
jgi:hypothetical protein